MNRISQLLARQAKRAYDMGIYLLGFLKKTVEWKLEFGAAAEDYYGENGETRSMGTVEVYADAGFGPDGGRSQQGVIVCYGGCPSHWTSTRQSFVLQGEAWAKIIAEMEDMKVASVWDRAGVDVEGRKALKLVMLQDN